MDDRTFDRLFTVLTAPRERRQAVSAGIAGVVAMVLAREAPAGEAKRNRKKHRKDARTKQAPRKSHHATSEDKDQPKSTVAAGCQPVGQTCEEDSDCCAGAECGLLGCRCLPGRNNCGGQCVDLETAHDHCGACNRACGANAICVNGSCISCPNGNTICGDVCCSPYRVCCDGTCVDALDTNPVHCGACGNRCPQLCIRNPDWSLDCVGGCCSEGQCVTNLQTDRSNCGTCGQQCRAGEECCGGACVDHDTNPDNCGRCGRTCRNGRVCCDGTCVDPEVNDAHCGACGNACFGDSWSCCAGTCISSRNHFCCQDQIVSRYNDDIFNCGGCGVVCPPGAQCCYGECCPLVYDCFPGTPGVCEPPD
jgi:hypothetical protein